MTTAPTTDRDWIGQAACVGQPPRRFTDPVDHHQTRAALAVCRHCLVRKPCLDTALARHPTADVGIWGGTTEPQRRHLRTRKDQASQLTLRRDEHGDLTDPSRRVLITRLPTGSTRDYMVFIDGRPTARTHRLADARQAAQRHLRPQLASATSPSRARTRVAPAVTR